MHLRLLYVSIVVYLISFGLPLGESRGEDVYGWRAFVACPFSLMTLPAWLANPCLWFSCRRLSQGRRAWAAGAAGAALALGLGGTLPWLPREAWPLGPAYWLWILSMAGAFAAALLCPPAPPTPPAGPAYPVGSAGAG